VHEGVDDNDSLDKRHGSVSNHHALSAVLQLSRSVRKVSVLAPLDYVLVLRASLTRPRLSRLLPAALLKAPRGIIRPLTGALLVAASLRNYESDLPLTAGLDALPWTPALLDASLYLVSTKPGHTAEFLGTLSIHRAIPALGTDGLQLIPPWHDTKR